MAKQTATEKLAEGIYWVGVLDADLEVFDIVMETKYGTTYNAYVVNTKEGAVLVETVKETYWDSYIGKLKSIVGDLNNVKYLITNHTEPDHSGSIRKIVDTIPGITVVGSKTAITYLKDIVNEPFQYRTAEDLGELKVGEKTFQFISVPFLHWPDSMYSYLKEDKILFTCDSFGAHYSPKCSSILISKLPKEEEEGYKDALLYYYTAIFGPFKEYVLKAYDKIRTLDIKAVCEGHGPVLDSRVWEIIDTYKNWSQLPQKDSTHKKVVMVYASAYGYTTEIGQQISKGLQDVVQNLNLKTYMVNIQNYAGLKGEIMGEILTADGVLLGTDTINGDAVPPIWDIALSMSPIVHGGKILSAFGSYGWGGEGVENICARLNQLRGQVLDGFRVKFRMSEKEQGDAYDFGKLYGKCILTGQVPVKPKPRVVGATNWEDLNPSGKVVLWRCIICGEIYAGVAPPLTCPACGVGQELFELYTPEEIGEPSKEPLKFVILGSGVAAVSAADAIRARNSVGTITMLSNEDRMPYYRPIVVDVLEGKLNDEEFFLKNEKWPAENKIDIHLKTEVKKIDTKNKKVVTDNGEYAYDRLIIATGARPFIPPIGADGLDGVIVIRSAASAEDLKERCKTAKNAVLIGGGVLGLENAYTLKQIGLNVTVAEVMNRLMPRQLDENASHMLAERVQEYGINLRLGVKTAIVGENGKVTGVKINEEVVPADIVIVNAGTRANAELAKAAGLGCGRGINVNEKMETDEPGIYAAGDSKTFAFGTEPVSLLAPNTELLAVGNPPANTDGYNIFTQKDPVTKQFVTLYFLEDKLKYGVAFNMQKKAGVIINGVRQGHSPARVIGDLYA